MTTEQILESEKDSLLDYLFSYCDNPLETASQDIKDLLADKDTQDQRYILESCYVNSFFHGTVPGNSESSIWLDVSEIEVPADIIEPDESDDFTISGDCAYLYIGYGLSVFFDIDKMIETVKGD